MDAQRWGDCPQLLCRTLWPLNNSIVLNTFMFGGRLSTEVDWRPRSVSVQSQSGQFPMIQLIQSWKSQVHAQHLASTTTWLIIRNIFLAHLLPTTVSKQRLKIRITALVSGKCLLANQAAPVTYLGTSQFALWLQAPPHALALNLGTCLWILDYEPSVAPRHLSAYSLATYSPPDQTNYM